MLFVHGLGGTPTAFETLIGSLDEQRFQPWVFYYPTALRIEVLGAYLSDSIELMHGKYNPETIAVVAHSMGGLVSLEALHRRKPAEAQQPIGAFISMATPYGGIGSARLGRDYSPVVMPCWIDLTPKSSFLTELFKNADESVPFHLFFGFDGDNSDGRVPLESALTPEALDRARSTIVVNADHMGILQDAQTLRRFEAVLDELPRAEAEGSPLQ